MTALRDAPLSKGMMMIAAYREARLRQRTVLRTSLPESRATPRAGHCQGQVAGEAACMTAVEAPAPVTAAAPEVMEPASVFANLASPAVSDKRTENTQVPADNAPPVAQDPPPDVVALAPPDDAAPALTEAAEPVLYDPPLAEIGFGPGMLIRLGQLGLRTTGDLARADANALRAALGDISRLVDVEAWIASARIAASTATMDLATAPEACA